MLETEILPETTGNEGVNTFAAGLQIYHRGVRSLDFLTPTPLLFWLNILRHLSDTFQSLGLQLLLKLLNYLNFWLCLNDRIRFSH